MDSSFPQHRYLTRAKSRHLEEKRVGKTELLSYKPSHAPLPLPQSRRRAKSPQSRRREKSPQSQVRSKSPQSRGRAKSPQSRRREKSPQSQGRSKSPAQIDCISIQDDNPEVFKKPAVPPPRKKQPTQKHTRLGKDVMVRIHVSLSGIFENDDVTDQSTE